MAVASPERSRRRMPHQRPPDRAQASPRGRSGESVSLETVLVARWQGLDGDGEAECLVCGGTMPAGRSCSSCGSSLS